MRRKSTLIHCFLGSSHSTSAGANSSPNNFNFKNAHDAHRAGSDSKMSGENFRGLGFSS